METTSNSVDILSDPQVKAFFLGVLDSQLTASEKYQRLLDFFQKEQDIQDGLLLHADEIRTGDQHEIAWVVSRVAQEKGIWKPQVILKQTADSIKRAIRRLKLSQHRDGGWGFQIEVSEFWATAYATLCLLAAKQLEQPDLGVDIESLLEKGSKWLFERPESWSVDHISPINGTPVYDVALMVLTFYEGTKQYYPESSVVISKCIDRVVQSQNDDGGWDAILWGSEVRTPTRFYSEVGATSAALRAIAEAGNANFPETVERGINWLIRTQNSDGSWNNGSTHPDSPKFYLSGVPEVNKTCDAVKGITAARSFHIPLSRFQEPLSRAVTWLESKERPLFDEQKIIKGWGWGDHPQIDYLGTCLTVETLVRLPNAPLELLSANASWLIQGQHPADGSLDDGKWPYEATARCALALIEYYKQIRTSPNFMSPTADESPK